MSNWYSEISVKIDNKGNTIEEIIEWFNNIYIFDNKQLRIDKKNNSFMWLGDEASKFVTKENPNELPDEDAIFKKLTINFPECEYSAYTLRENSICSVNDEMFITVKNGIFEVKTPKEASIYDLYFDNYAEFEEYVGDYLSEDQFNQCKEKGLDRVYVTEDGCIYSENEYYENMDVLFKRTIKEIISKAEK